MHIFVHTKNLGKLEMSADNEVEITEEEKEQFAEELKKFFEKDVYVMNFEDVDGVTWVLDDSELLAFSIVP